MDWKYKRFYQEAVYAAAPAQVLEAAHIVIAETLPRIDSTPDGLVARGENAWHDTTATVRAEPAAHGTKLGVELLVERASLWGFMLVDIGGYYDGQLRRWLFAVARRLEQSPISISKPPISQGCLTGCLVYLVVGTLLSLMAIPLDYLFYAEASKAALGPLTVLALLIGLLAGVAAFLYRAYPHAAIWGSKKS
jgi:hypothetical protein